MSASLSNGFSKILKIGILGLGEVAQVSLEHYTFGRMLLTSAV